MNHVDIHRLREALLELAKSWREMQKRPDMFVMSAHDCADDLERLLDAHTQQDVE